MIREKQITIIKMRTKVNIKIKFKGWNWKKNIQNKIYITIKSLITKFDIISK
jgi:hypothetical protein